MDHQTSYAYRSLSSVDPPSNFLSNEDCSSDLEGKHHKAKMVITSEMRKKRISFGRRSSRYDDPPSSFSPRCLAQMSHSSYLPSVDVDEVPPGILRQGRFTSNMISLTQRRRCHTLMTVTAAFACLIGAASYLLNRGQLRPLTDGAYLRKLMGRSKSARYEGMMTWLNAETAGLPAEERQRVSICAYARLIVIYLFNI